MPSELYVDNIFGEESSGVNIIAGIISATSFVGPGISTRALDISDDGVLQGAVSDLNFVGATVVVDSNVGVGTITVNQATTAQYADVAGIATVATSADTALTSGYADVAGIATAAQGLSGVPNIQVGLVTTPTVSINGASLFDASTLDTGLNIRSNQPDGNIYIYSYGTDGSGTGAGNIYVTPTGVDVYSNWQAGGVGEEKWAFSGGNITFPDGTIQSTAFTGAASTYAAYADVAGIATYATTAGVSTVAGYADVAGIATVATTAVLKPVGLPTTGDYLGFDGTENVWNSIYDVNAIQNTIYCNVNVKDIQTAIDEAVPGTQTQIVMSPGTFLEGSYPTNAVTVDACNNLTIVGPSAPENAYSCQIGDVNPTDYRDFNITNGSVYFNLKDFAIKGNLNINGTQMKAYFDNVTVVGQTTFVGINSNFIFFENCNFTDNVTVNSEFAGQAFFLNCTFNNHSVISNVSSALQVIISNCTGLSSLPPTTVATVVGLNALENGTIQIRGDGSNITGISTNIIAGVGISLSTVGGNVTINSTNTGIATQALYSDVAGISTYATIAGVSTVSGYADVAGIATAATSADTALTSGYADVAGIATYSGTAGIATVAETILTTSSPQTNQFLIYDGAGNDWFDLKDVTLVFGSTYYANQINQDIQTVLDSLTPGQFAQIYFAAGYNFNGPDVTVTDQVNINITGPDTPTGTFHAGLGSTLPRGMVISGSTSTRVKIENLQIKGAVTIDGTLGRHYFKNVSFDQGISLINDTQNFVIFENCSFGGPVSFGSSMTASVTMSGCNFNGQTITNNAASPLQVIVTNGLNLPSLSIANVTLLGQNSDGVNVGLIATQSTLGALQLGASPVGISSTTYPAVVNASTGAVAPTAGASGSFTAQSGETVTVVNGLIVSIV